MYYLILNRFTTYTVIAIPVSYFFGFFSAWILEIMYYRFMWLDQNEPDKPDIDVLKRVDAMEVIRSVSARMLSSRKFYSFGIILSFLTFLIFFASSQSTIIKNLYLVDSPLTPSIVAIHAVAISIFAIGIVFWRKEK